MRKTIKKRPTTKKEKNKEFHKWIKKTHPGLTGVNGDGWSTLVKEYKEFKKTGKSIKQIHKEREQKIKKYLKRNGRSK